MRGLDVRLAYARNKVLCSVGVIVPGSDDDDGWMVFQAAKASGYHDHLAGQSEVPILFRDEPELVNAWKEGQDEAAEFEEMSECTGCNDGTGNPCCIHG